MAVDWLMPTSWPGRRSNRIPKKFLMRVVLFYQTLLSDWNHGNAHFLRGVASELLSRGHQVAVFEPADSLCLHNLLSQYGDGPLQRFREIYPHLESTRYDLNRLDLDAALENADIVIVHE